MYGVLIGVEMVLIVVICYFELKVIVVVVLFLVVW